MPNYPPPIFAFCQPSTDDPQLPTDPPSFTSTPFQLTEGVQSSNSGRMGFGIGASQEQGSAKQVEGNQTQPARASPTLNHSNIVAQPPKPRGPQRNRQTQQVQQVANDNASDAISFQFASTAVCTGKNHGGPTPQHPPAPSQPSELQPLAAPQLPTSISFPKYQLPQALIDINSIAPFSYQTGQATDQYIDQGMEEFSVSDIQGTSQQFAMGSSIPLDAQPSDPDEQWNAPPHPSNPPQQITPASGQAYSDADEQRNAPPVLSRPSNPPQQITSVSGQAYNETAVEAQNDVGIVSVDELLCQFWELPNDQSSAWFIMHCLQTLGLFLDELSLFMYWATDEMVLAIQFEGQDAIPLTSHILLGILSLRINEHIIYTSFSKAITPSLQIISLPCEPEAISPDANSPYFEPGPTLDRWPSQYDPYKFRRGPDSSMVVPFGIFPIVKARELSAFRATITFLLHTPRPGRPRMFISDTSPYFHFARLYLLELTLQIEAAELREREETEKKARRELRRRLSEQKRREKLRKVEEQRRAEEKRKGKQKATDEQWEIEGRWPPEGQLVQLRAQEHVQHYQQFQWRIETSQHRRG